jgi:hypothetical protein
MEIEHAVEENEMRAQVEEEVENVADLIQAGFASLENRFDKNEEQMKKIPSYQQVLMIVSAVVAIAVGILKFK